MNDAWKYDRYVEPLNPGGWIASNGEPLHPGGWVTHGPVVQPVQVIPARYSGNKCFG